MKTSLFAALFALVSIPAFAGAVSTHGYVIAEVVSHPGFVPPSMRFISGVRVYDNGSVVHFSADKETFKTKLSARDLSGLKKEIEGIRETELIDRDAKKPRCMDAPSVVYSVKESAASPELVIARWASCHSFELKRGEGRSIKLLLDRLQE